MSAPSVYAAINAITAELATKGIAKSRTNEVDDYKYRSIDDVLERLAPLLSKHGLCVLPRAIERSASERSDEQERLVIHVVLRVEFTLTSVHDGTSHVVEAYGEALDGGDKATAKAMSAAYKAAMVQSFCIATCGTDDADRASCKLTRNGHDPAPIQGWEQWCADISDMVSVCESQQAIAIVQDRHRETLKGLSRERPGLYTELGQVFAGRRQLVRERAAPIDSNGPTSSRKSTRRRQASSDERQVQHA